MTRIHPDDIKEIANQVAALINIGSANFGAECLTTMSDIDLMAAAAIERNAIKRANRPRRVRNASL